MNKVRNVLEETLLPNTMRNDGEDSCFVILTLTPTGLNTFKVPNGLDIFYQFLQILY